MPRTGLPIVPLLRCRRGSRCTHSARTAQMSRSSLCEHERVIINGAVLTQAPLKVVLVSEPGTGRVWRTLSRDEVAALLSLD